MDILGEIRENFATLIEKSALKLDSIDSKYKAWAIRMENFYGVAIPYSSDKEKIVEKFNNVRLWNESIIINGKEESLLLLTSTEESLRYQFATICSEFVDPGAQGERRDFLVNDSLDWWESWKSLLGNSVKNISCSSVIAELLVVEKLIKLGHSPTWSGKNKSTHDIEVDNCSYEVKSTVTRYESIVNISSQYQLDSRNSEIHLIFCRLEKSKNGDNINDVVDRLVKLNIEKYELENHLYGLGFEEGSSSRSNKYKLHEMRNYVVDDEFPKITLQSFKDNKLPNSILDMTYSIDLVGIEYEEWNS